MIKLRRARLFSKPWRLNPLLHHKSSLATFLHNICMDIGDTLDPDNDVVRDNLDPQPPCEPINNYETSGSVLRETD